MLQPEDVTKRLQTIGLVAFPFVNSADENAAGNDGAVPKRDLVTAIQVLIVRFIGHLKSLWKRLQTISWRRR